MSYMSQLKSKWQYEKDVPRCGNCVHLKESYIKLTTNSHTKRVHQHCNLGGFNCSKMDICKKWESKEGDILA